MTGPRFFAWKISNAGKLRYGKRIIVYCEADDDADKIKDQPPGRGKVEDNPKRKMVKSEISDNKRWSLTASACCPSLYSTRV